MRLRYPLKPGDKIQRFVELQILLKCLRADLDLAIAQHIVQQVFHLARAQQRGVHLDADVAAHFRQQESDDALNFAAGQPWNVERLMVSLMRAGNGRSR